MWLLCTTVTLFIICDPASDLHLQPALVCVLLVYGVFLHNASNFQSNLDNPRDISQELLGILQSPQQVTFLQLYVTSPHIHFQMPFKHPVSGTSVTSGLSQHAHERQCTLGL